MASNPRNAPQSDPSPEEIRQQAERIRSTWSPQEMARRSSCKPIAWLPPLFSATELPGTMSEQDS
jgi:hypothetical protein